MNGPSGGPKRLFKGGERERDRETERQTDRQTERQTDRETAFVMFS